MKIYLRNKEQFSKDAQEFYESNFTITGGDEADVIVVNDFTEANYPNKIVARNSTGLDGIVAREIISLRGEDLSDLTAVAELCLGMAIYCTRIFKGEELRGKTLGLIGYGRISKQFKKLAENVGMRVMAFDNSNGTESTLAFDRLETLLPNSDIVSLHITANPENRNFMDKKKFAMMKQGVIFLNSARSWLVNQDDLKDVLDSGKIAGAWEDFDGFSHPKIVRTLHLGGSTVESRAKSEKIIAEKLLKLKNK